MIGVRRTLRSPYTRPAYIKGTRALLGPHLPSASPSLHTLLSIHPLLDGQPGAAPPAPGRGARAQPRLGHVIVAGIPALSSPPFSILQASMVQSLTPLHFFSRGQVHQELDAKRRSVSSVSFPCQRTRTSPATSPPPCGRPQPPPPPCTPAIDSQPPLVSTASSPPSLATAAPPICGRRRRAPSSPLDQDPMVPYPFLFKNLNLKIC